MFQLEFLKLLIVNVVDLLVPQVDVGFDLLSFCKHCDTNFICLEDKHPPISTSTRDQPTLVLDEETEVIKPYMHALIDDLSDKY